LAQQQHSQSGRSPRSAAWLMQTAAAAAATTKKKKKNHDPCQPQQQNTRKEEIRNQRRCKRTATHTPHDPRSKNTDRAFLQLFWARTRNDSRPGVAHTTAHSRHVTWRLHRSAHHDARDKESTHAHRTIKNTVGTWWGKSGNDCSGAHPQSWKTASPFCRWEDISRSSQAVCFFFAARLLSLQLIMINI
jgi:hypothetical protein